MSNGHIVVSKRVKGCRDGKKIRVTTDAGQCKAFPCIPPLTDRIDTLLQLDLYAYHGCVREHLVDHEQAQYKRTQEYYKGDLRKFV